MLKPTVFLAKHAQNSGRTALSSPANGGLLTHAVATRRSSTSIKSHESCGSGAAIAAADPNKLIARVKLALKNEEEHVRITVKSF